MSDENSPLDDFKSGATTARVIVDLRQPAGAEAAPALADLVVRQQVREDVTAVLDRVIGSLNPGEIKITNRFVYIYGFSAEVTLQGLRELIDNGEVELIEKDQILEAHLAQGIPLMNASAARNTYNGTGLSIAICDTGIDYTHPMLGGGGFPNGKVIGGYDCGDEDTNPMDGQGHGTCCAGIAAGSLGATGDYIGGVAYNARLYAVKIAFGSGGSAYTSDMIQGWEWCVTHQNDNPSNPIRVISTSFGGNRMYSACDAYSSAMTAAAANAVAAGITLFASSGNDGYCDSIGWPACISHVISVGAVYDAAFGTYYPCVSANSCATKYAGGCSSGWYAIDSTAADMVTSYSNTASFLGVLAPSNAAYTTDIVGAGGYSTGDYDDSFGGTSAACPYAAGAAACLQSAAKARTGSFLTPAQVRSKLIGTGDSITDGKVAITKPRVNLGNAVDSLPSPVSSYRVLAGGDYTGDGRSDIAIFRPSSGLWSIRGVGACYFGGEGDIPVTGDYDGDGSSDIALFRPSSGMWSIRGGAQYYYGNSGDIPVPADYNGDGYCDSAIFRPSSGLWSIRGGARVYLGATSDLPVPGCYDDDGSAEIAVFRPSNGLWSIRGVTRAYFGVAGDIPVPMDYTPEGFMRPAIYRPSTGLWSIRGGYAAYFGGASDQPVPACYYGKSQGDFFAVFRAGDGRWAIYKTGKPRYYFGSAGDIPVTR